jgi:carbon storage regulator CsrA
MLVISRKLGSAVLIGQDIVVRVMAIDSSGKVRIGIDAPPGVPLLREELADRPGAREFLRTGVWPARLDGEHSEPAGPHARGEG